MAFPEVSLKTLQRVDASIQAYDRARLTTYQGRAGNPNNIECRTLGAVTAMRFPALGYFNQVYGYRKQDAAVLDELIAFYQDQVQVFKLYVAPDTEPTGARASLQHAGFAVHEELVRLFHPAPKPLPQRWPEGLTIAPLQPGEVDTFFSLYLAGFEADSTTREDALDNMRLLFGMEGLHCLFAKMHGMPVAIAMMHVTPRCACLCAGAVLGPWQNRGIQSALINARLRLASDLGCDLAVSWTHAGSVSARNLMRHGFKPAYLDPVWQYQLANRKSPLTSLARHRTSGFPMAPLHPASR